MIKFTQRQLKDMVVMDCFLKVQTLVGCMLLLNDLQLYSCLADIDRRVYYEL